MTPQERHSEIGKAIVIGDYNRAVELLQVIVPLTPHAEREWDDTYEWCLRYCEWKGASR